MMIEPKVYLTAKKGELPKSCQDAYCFNENKTRFAVADGATREFFSAKIAHELVDRFCLGPDESNKNIFLNKKYEEWLKPIQDKWLRNVEDIVHNKKKKVNYAVKNRFNRREAGASTFVGLELDKELFTTMIIGDSCLFHIRDNKILKCYLIDDPDEFDNSPDFFFSRSPSTMIPIRIFTEPEVIVGKYEIGDYFLLASDAISKFFLIQTREVCKWEDLWKNLLMNDRDWYYKLIEQERNDKNLDDDDVIILIVPTTNTPELKPFEDPETYAIEIDSSKEIKNINNTFNEQTKVSNNKTEDETELKNEDSIVLESDMNSSIEVTREESISNILKEQVEVSDYNAENEVEIKSECSVVLKSDMKALSEVTQEESICIAFKEQAEVSSNNIEDEKELKNRKVVLLIYNEDIRMKEVNAIKEALEKRNITFIEQKYESKIDYAHGILILLESKKRGMFSSKEEITRTFCMFTKESREKYELDKKYKAYIKKIRNFQSCDLLEIVELVKEDLNNG